MLVIVVFIVVFFDGVFGVVLGCEMRSLCFDMVVRVGVGCVYG